ncbi:MAG: 3-methyl-2-oxobutanoate hydroxymethyltransferase [Candidatus Eiseniibacteriota bacterium]
MTPTTTAKEPAAGTPRPRWTAPAIAALKTKGEKIAVVTAYDYPTARLVDESGAEIILVGDSLGMVVLGYESTLPVTIADMIHHTKAVMRAKPRSLVVADLPFMTYQTGPVDALRNAGRLVQKGGADAVKLEGGARNAEAVRAIVTAGIPVMGHLGLTPQSVLAMGGYRVQGRSDEDAARLVREAKLLEACGAFSIVLEGIPKDLAGEVTRAVGVPTIGIGAGRDVDGQVLVWHDVMGLWFGKPAKFVRRYAELGDAARGGLTRFVEDIKSGTFPSDNESYGA